MGLKSKILLAVVVAIASLGNHWYLSRAPKLSIDREHVTVPPIRRGEQYEAIFVISNEGNAPLNIEGIVTPCGCTSATMDATLLGQGEETNLRVVVSNSSKQRAVVVLLSNDPEQPALEIELKLERSDPLSCEPARCDFGAVSPSELPIQIRLLVSVFDSDINAAEVNTTTDILPSELAIATSTPDEGHIVVDVTLKDGTAGWRGGFIDIAHAPTRTILSVPVVAKFRD